jgi:hypothetical protein
VVLVLASVAVGTVVVGRADTTRPMYAARHTLVPGQPLTAGDVRVVRVQLGGRTPLYLPATQGFRAGAVVIRGVPGGELVPASAIGDESSMTGRPVAVPVAAASAQGLRAGSLVDVWVAGRADKPQTYDEPILVVAGAEVVSVSGGTGVLSGSTDATVRLLLAGGLVAQVLSAVDNGARIDLVPLPGSVPRGGS